MSSEAPVISGYTLADDPDRRLALREEKRRQLAEIQVRFERIAELEELVRGIDKDSDEAADRHSAKCEPLQKELASIDDSRISAILKGKAKSAAPRRAELLSQLSQANIELELAVEANKREKEKLEAEIKELRSGLHRDAVENKLRDLATVEQLDRRWLLSLRLQNAGRWLDHCRSRLEAVKSELNDGTKNYTDQSVGVLQQRVRKWKLAVDEARDELFRIQTEQSELLDAMLTD